MNLLKPPVREHFADGSTYNPSTGGITFGITLPVDAPESFIEDQGPSPKPILNWLARCIETQGNPLARAALRTLFDCIYDRTTPDERISFPNWFDSQ
jgi:hypothetical protein